MTKQYTSEVKVKIIEHSTSYDGTELITIQTTAYKAIDSEIEKHRMISSNSSSDRAIPFDTMLDRIYYLPADIRKEQQGMQGNDKFNVQEVEMIHEHLAEIRNSTASMLSNLKGIYNVHKQTLNRYLLGFSLQDKIMTATRQEWDYFLSLRNHEAADPNIKMLAELLPDLFKNSVPVHLMSGEYHLPYITKLEKETYPTEALIKFSIARCARVSYYNHDGTDCNVEKDVKLYDMLKRLNHMSPFEHAATPIKSELNTDESRHFWVDYPNNEIFDGVTHLNKKMKFCSGNFCGWIQHRHLVTY